MADPASVLLGVALAFQQGLAARNEGRPAEAVEHFSSVITADVNAPDFRNTALIERARAFDALGRDDRAESDLRRVFDQDTSPVLRARVLAVLVETGGSPAAWLPPDPPAQALAASRAPGLSGLTVLDQSIQTNALTASVTAVREGRTLQAELQVRGGVWEVREARLASAAPGGPEVAATDPRLLAEGRGEALEELPVLVSALVTHAAAHAGSLPTRLEELDPGVKRAPGGQTWTHPAARREFSYLFRAGFALDLAQPDTLIAAAPFPWRGLREVVNVSGRVTLHPEADFRATARRQGWDDPALMPKELAPSEVSREIEGLAASITSCTPTERAAARRRLRDLAPVASAWLCEWLDSPDPELQSCAESVLFGK
jgi:hypothetical protein